MKKKLGCMILAGILAALSLTGCTGKTESAQPAAGRVAEIAAESKEEAAKETAEQKEETVPQSLTEITAYGVIDPQISAQQIIAEKKGFFEEQGLKVTNKLIQSGGEMSPLIAGNTAQVSFESTYTNIALAANGVKVKMLAPMADIGGTQCVVARKGLVIKSAKDLEGKKIGMASGSGVLVAIRKMCTELGIDINQLTFVTLSPSEQIAALEKGDIDLMACWEPWAGNAVKAGGTLLFSGLKSYLPDKQGDVEWLNFHTTLQVTEEFLNKNPEAAEALLRALAKATAFINDNREEAAEIIAKEINLDKSQVAEIMSKNTYSMEYGDAFVNGANVMAAFMKEMGNIPIAPEFNTYADLTPLKNAVPELVTVK